MTVPKLRFPEFLDAGAWDLRQLEDVAPLQRGFDLPSAQIKPGNIPVVYSNGIQNFHSVGMVKAPGLVTGRSGTIGKIHFIKEGDYWPHNTSLWVTSFKGNFPKFIYYLYTCIGMERFASGSGVPTLNRNDVHAFRTYLPSSISEQKKVADCLASIDDRITTETQKLDTLRAHKKGLMQQLFPAEGETLPQLRFPEFRDAGEWVEKQLKEISVINQGLQIEISKRFTTEVENSYFYITNEFLKENSTTVFYIQNPPESVICDEDDILMTRTGNTGKVVTGVRGAFHNNFFRIKYNKKIHKDFFIYFLRSERTQRTILNLAGTSTIPDLNHGDFYKIKIQLPSISEQRKIADCLSSLDELITLQTQKIATLKQHKKGLMQQLFPSLE